MRLRLYVAFFIAALAGPARTEFGHDASAPTGTRAFAGSVTPPSLLTVLSSCTPQRPGNASHPIPSPQIERPQENPVPPPPLARANSPRPPERQTAAEPPPRPKSVEPRRAESPDRSDGSREVSPDPETPATETGGREKGHGESPERAAGNKPETGRVHSGKMEDRVADFFQRQGCLNCHGPSSSRPLFEENGAPLSGAVAKRIHEVLEGVRTFGGPMAQALSAVRSHLASDESDRRLIEAWARSLATVREEPQPAASAEKTAPGFPPLPAAQYKNLQQAIAFGHLKPSDIVKTEDIAKRLKGPNKPVILNIGNTVNLVGSVNLGIIGGTFAGGKQKDQIAKRLEQLTATVPDRTKEIFIYCACCDAETCPNVLGSLKKLREMGYSNIRVLDLPPFVDADEWQKETGISIVPEMK